MNKMPISAPDIGHTTLAPESYAPSKEFPIFHLFSLFDEYKTGFISPEQIKLAVESSGISQIMPLDTMKVILEAVPEQKRKKINYTTFLAAIYTLGEDFRAEVFESARNVSKFVNSSSLKRKSLLTLRAMKETKTVAEEIAEIIDLTKKAASKIVENSKLEEKDAGFSKELIGKMEWARQKIAGGNIYESYVNKEEEEEDYHRKNSSKTVDAYISGSKNAGLSERDHDQVRKWLNEYSERSNSAVSYKELKDAQVKRSQKLDSIGLTNLLKAKFTVKATEYMKEIAKQKLLEGKTIPEILLSKGSDIPDVKVIDAFYERFLHDLETSNDYRNFDIFEFSKKVGRPNTLILLFTHMVKKHKLFETSVLSEEKYPNFIAKIYEGYKKDVAYHNDLHGIDVAHYCDYVLTVGELKQVADLDPLDTAALLVSAVVHDFRHPGTTNGYHINTRSNLAVRYNDISVLESYHIAQAFKVLGHSESDIFHNLANAERQVVRKRMVQCVLSTDMSKHAGLVSTLNTVISTYKVSVGQNRDQIVKAKTGTDKFEAQQFLMSIAIHAGDVSNPTKKFESFQKWTHLLFTEFFAQGDLEKKSGLPISFLCGRETTSIPQAQIGFSNGITLPLFELLSEVIPNIGDLVYTLKENVEEWKKYQALGNYDLVEHCKEKEEAKE